MFRYKFLSMVIAAGLLFSQSIPAARAATVCNSAQFVSDLTIPDGSSFAPGVAFRKTWRLLNNGTCTWSTSYTLVWAGGDQMNAPLSTRLPVSVAPGKMLDLTVNLAAPAATGHYKGLFRLRNAAGGLFGIGAASSDPFWVDINVTDIRAVIYDFVANAPYAQWKSGAGALPFPGASGDFRGYSSQVNSPHLEDDSYDIAPGLLTVPQNRLNGYIQATYPEFQIQSGDKLQTLVSCEFGATGCSATFRIDYLLSNNVQKTLWTWREAYDRRFYRADLDLSSLAGQKVRFIFMLLSSGSASGDRAIWGSPRILRLGGGLPPAPPPTLTPLPALTPTATPLAPPPPTLQPTGCDKATFVTDVTVQDGTSFVPDETFTKTWRLKNSGACVWTPSYKLVYYSGDQMGAPTTVNFPWGVTTNQSVDLSINMVAPHIPGKYRGYWILVNASGQYFGIGADASKPIWVDINVSGEATQESGYAFWMNACSAEWRTGSGSLACPSTEGDSKGFVIPQQSTQLEDGTMGPAPSILMAPENKYNGYIQGVFPAFTVLPGDHFVTSTGCEYGYSCYVTFRLDYMTANGGVFNFWSWREQKDNKNNMASVDLSPLAGRSVQFILTILATGSATGDRVRWIGPAIVRVSAEVPPTLTPSPTFTPAPTVPPAPAVVPLPQINKLFMINSANGWGIGNNTVVRTSDGGATWYNFSMPNVTSVDHAFFQNASKGWVIAKTFTDVERTSLFRTIDGGRTWITYSNIPFNQGLIQFLGDSNGFVLAGMPDGMQKHAVQLYQTADGGATWTLNYAIDPSQPGNTLPFSGHKDGMGFRNTSTGWVGGDYPANAFSYLFKTTDSGATWTQQPLTLPSGYQDAFLTITAPTFFGQNDAVMPVWMTIGPDMRDMFLYVTHDGGNTWTASAGFARNGINADFVTLRDAFSWDWDGFFYVTNNSGASWRQVRPNVDFGGSIQDMDFVSTSVGWVIDTDQNGHTALYRTNNGGLVWNQLYSNIPTQPVPNLAISAMHIELQNTSCLMPGDQMGVRVWITNDGPVAAGSFLVRVFSADQTVSGLAAGETTSLFFAGYGNPVTATVDPTNAVLESNEYDNLRLETLPVPTPPLPCPTPSELLQKIVTSLNAHDFVAARNPMGQTFSMAFWQSQGNSYTPDEAINELQTNYIGASTVLVPDPSKDLSVLLDRPDPYSIVGLDASHSLALFVSGWGLDGKGEAVLFVTQGTSGVPYWHSVLIAPTGFAPATLPVAYAVVRVPPNAGLDIHQDAGASQPVTGSFAFDAVDVRRTGPTANADNATWVEVLNPGGGTGWVNSDDLTEYVTRQTFCADERIPLMIEQLKGSMIQQDGNGDMFAALVGPKHGVAINFWRDVPPVDYTSVTARNIFADTTMYNWGSGPAAYPDGTPGTFAQIVQSDLVDVFNSNYQLGCDDPTLYVTGMTANPWPNTNIHYYSILKPPTSDTALDWKVWLIGFEYVDGVPYLYATVHYIHDA